MCGREWAQFNCTGCRGWYTGKGYCLSDVIRNYKFVEHNAVLCRERGGAVN